MLSRSQTLLPLALTALAVLAALRVFISAPDAVSPPAAPLVIGASLELTGRFAATGQSSLSALQMAVAEINAAGGLLGHPVRLAVADNRSSEEYAVTAFQQLIEQDNACAVIGPSYSAIAIAGNPIAERFAVPFICSWGTSPRVTIDDSGRTRPFAFRACFVDSFQGAVIGRFAGQTLGLRRAAVYIDESTLYSRSMTSFFEPAFAQTGGRIVERAFYRPPLNPIALQKSVQQLLNSNPDVLFVPGYYTDVGTIIRQLRDAGFQGPILGGDGWEENLLVTLLPPSYLNNCYYSNHYAPDDNSPAVQNFLLRYRTFSGGSEPIQAAVLAYDAATMLFAAISRAGTADPQQIRTELERLSSVSCVTGTITMAEHHTPSKSAVMIEFKDGHGQFRERIEAK